MAIRLVYEDREYVCERGDRLETDLGVLEIPTDVTVGEGLETHLGHEFAVRSLRLPDWFDHFERSGAPVLPRDIGLILGETGIGRGDRVLDIGTGTGVLAAALANVGASVHTFERDEGAARLARDNMRMAGLEERVSIRTGDARSILDEDPDQFDAITLDTGDAPWFAQRARGLLVPGGYLAAYSPFVEGARAVVEAARAELDDVRCVETIQRHLDVDERGTRPATTPVGHTGYVTFARRQ